jgi:hypothetical protein
LLLKQKNKKWKHKTKRNHAAMATTVAAAATVRIATVKTAIVPRIANAIQKKESAVKTKIIF